MLFFYIFLFYQVELSIIEFFKLWYWGVACAKRKTTKIPRKIDTKWTFQKKVVTIRFCHHQNVSFFRNYHCGRGKTHFNLSKHWNNFFRSRAPPLVTKLVSHLWFLVVFIFPSEVSLKQKCKQGLGIFNTSLLLLILKLV